MLDGRRLMMAAACVMLLCSCDGGGDVPDVAHASADAISHAGGEAGRHFLDTYVTADGRVRRIDENDDTVSEGQAYAMLVAVGVGDEARFARVWSWTRRNLQQPDGLLAWHWADGRVVDDQSAIDADVLTTYALALAAHRFERPELLTHAQQLATAVMDAATLPALDGRVLVSPWAKNRRLVNPSYLMPTALAGLADLTGDERWAALEQTGRRLVESLTETVPHLPPDWASLSPDGSSLAPARSPTDRTPARTGLDAWRVLLNFAVDCSPSGREIAARSWSFLRGQSDIVAAYDLSGRPAVDWSHPAAMVGAASAAAAADDGASAGSLLREATAMNRSNPSYYGSALLAVGYLLLDSDRLGGCPPGVHDQTTTTTTDDTTHDTTHGTTRESG